MYNHVCVCVCVYTCVGVAVGVEVCVAFLVGWMWKLGKPDSDYQCTNQCLHKVKETCTTHFGL